MVGIQCVNQILQKSFDGDDFYQEKNEHRNESLDFD